MTDEEAKRLHEAIGQLQGLVLANEYVLMELMLDLARTTPEPKRHLSNLFERVSARSDQRPPGAEKFPQAEMRRSLETMFALATRALDQPSGRAP